MRSDSAFTVNSWCLHLLSYRRNTCWRSLVLKTSLHSLCFSQGGWPNPLSCWSLCLGSTTWSSSLSANPSQNTIKSSSTWPSDPFRCRIIHSLHPTTSVTTRDPRGSLRLRWMTSDACCFLSSGSGGGHPVLLPQLWGKLTLSKVISSDTSEKWNWLNTVNRNWTKRSDHLHDTLIPLLAFKF